MKNKILTFGVVYTHIQIYIEQQLSLGLLQECLVKYTVIMVYPLFNITYLIVLYL